MASIELQLSSQIGKGARLHIDAAEELLRQTCKLHPDLELGIPSYASRIDGGWRDSHFLIAKSEVVVDVVADELATKLANWTASDGLSIVLIRREGGGSPTEFVRKVLPTDLGWIETRHTARHSLRENDTIEEWPVRLRHIAKIANRYYSVGGNDVIAVFRNAVHLHQFVANLDPCEKAELLAAAQAIASSADHVYIMNWFNDTFDGKIDWPRTKALYFLALLDRLREEGVFQAVPAINSFHYIDWDKMGG